jgi:hypothetical protein
MRDGWVTWLNPRLSRLRRSSRVVDLPGERADCVAFKVHVRHPGNSVIDEKAVTSQHHTYLVASQRR